MNFSPEISKQFVDLAVELCTHDTVAKLIRFLLFSSTFSTNALMTPKQVLRTHEVQQILSSRAYISLPNTLYMYSYAISCLNNVNTVPLVMYYTHSISEIIITHHFINRTLWLCTHCK